MHQRALTTRPASWWQRLSGVELRRRLTQRGVTAGRAELLVRGRDTDHHADAIDRLLGPE